jgi:hypothetical protein
LWRKADEETYNGTLQRWCSASGDDVRREKLAARVLAKLAARLAARLAAQLAAQLAARPAVLPAAELVAELAGELAARVLVHWVTQNASFSHYASCCPMLEGEWERGSNLCRSCECSHVSVLSTRTTETDGW